MPSHNIYKCGFTVGQMGEEAGPRSRSHFGIGHKHGSTQDSSNEKSHWAMAGRVKEYHNRNLGSYSGDTVRSLPCGGLQWEIEELHAFYWWSVGPSLEPDSSKRRFNSTRPGSRGGCEWCSIGSWEG